MQKKKKLNRKKYFFTNEHGSLRFELYEGGHDRSLRKKLSLFFADNIQPKLFVNRKSTVVFYVNTLKNPKYSILMYVEELRVRPPERTIFHIVLWLISEKFIFTI